MEQNGLKQSLKQYFNECVATMPLYNNDSFEERVERDCITIAVLQLSMKY